MSAYKFGTAYRPLMAGTRHIVSAGHYLAAQAGLMILEAGGNAIDAGVAAGLTLNVVEPQMCCFTGVAPIMIYLGRERRLVTIDGLGTWPRRDLRAPRADGRRLRTGKHSADGRARRS